MGDGLATEVNHDAWYIRRKMLDPVFHRTQLRLAFDTFNLTSDHLMKELGAYAESGETVTMAPIIHRSTLDVIMRVSVMSITVNYDFCSCIHSDLRIINTGPVAHCSGLKA